EVEPGGQQHGRVDLELFLVPSRAERASADLHHHLADRAAIQMTALDLGAGDPLHEVVEQLDRLVLVVEGRMAKNADAIEWQRRSRAHPAAQAAPALASVQRAQSVYLVIV